MNRTGVQSIYTSNLYSSSLDGELVQDTATTFIPRTEQGAYRLYTFINNTWTIVDKDGLTYKLGYSSSTQVYDNAQPTHTAMWMLEEQRDTNNNFISYGYVKDSNQIYPDVITYTGSGSTAGAHQVTFLREARGDTLTAYDKGFAATTSYRISAIKAWADGALVRTYTLTYGTGITAGVQYFRPLQRVVALRAALKRSLFLKSIVHVGDEQKMDGERRMSVTSKQV